MGKILLGALVGALIVAGAFYFINKPEPTAQERLDAAIDDVNKAAKEAGSAATDVVNEIGNDLADSATGAVAQMAEKVAQLSNDTKAEFEKLIESWNTEGVITDTGIDYDKARAAVENSDLAEAAKTKVYAVLDSLQAAPEAVSKKLEELKTQLEK